MNCYMIALLMATIEMFSAVMFGCTFCANTQARPFYCGVAKRGVLTVALGFILTDGSTREDVLGTIQVLGMTALGILNSFIHVKLQCVWGKTTPANING